MRVTKKTATSTKKSAFSLYPRLLDGSSSKRKLLDTYGDVAGDGTITINLRKVCEKLKYAGVRVLVSNAISDAVECYIAYEERNEVEHAFNTLKSRLSCNRTQVHTTEAWEGKLFLQMLATAISAIVRARIKIYNQGAVGKNGQKKYRVHYDSDHKLLAKLNNIYMTHVNDGWVFDEIVEEKKELFRILNLPVPTSGQFVEQNDAQEAPDDLIDIEEIATETAFDDVADL